MVSADDLANVEGRNPFALRRAIRRARTTAELAAAARRIPELFGVLVDSGLSPGDVGRVLSLQSDTVTTRLIDLAVERPGQPPAAWAWLALGSAARRELTLHLGRGLRRTDLKLVGVVPVANLARLHALASSVTVSATLDRPVAVEESRPRRSSVSASCRSACGGRPSFATRGRRAARGSAQQRPCCAAARRR